MLLHTPMYITCHYILLHLLLSFTHNYLAFTCYILLGAEAPPNEPAENLVLPLPRHAPQTDPSLLIGKVCAAIYAWPDAYTNAMAQWRARFPAAAFPDRRAWRDFELGDASGSQKCTRNPDTSGYGRVNSGTWFEAAQLRANQLAAAGGHVERCAVAGLVWVSDVSFGGKNTSWHGVYCKWNPARCICAAASTM